MINTHLMRIRMSVDVGKCQYIFNIWLNKVDYHMNVLDLSYLKQNITIENEMIMSMSMRNLMAVEGISVSTSLCNGIFIN